MRRILQLGVLLFIAVTASIWVGAPLAYARPPGFIFEVKGIITENGVPVDDALVSIDCYGDFANVHSSGDGTYYAHPTNCWTEQLVKVHVYAKDAAGNYTKEGYGQAPGQETTVIDIKIVPGHSVPEYSSVGSLVALSLAGGALYIVRRRSI